MFLVSTDSVFVHKNWDEVELCNIESMRSEVPYPMLTDVGGRIGDMYGVYDAVGGVDIRGTVLISPEGIVQLNYINIPPLGRNPDEIVRCVQALQETVKTGKVAPSKWTPGKNMLDPSYENSGKVWKTLQK